MFVLEKDVIFVICICLFFDDVVFFWGEKKKGVENSNGKSERGLGERWVLVIFWGRRGISWVEFG